jgi:HEAT repeat protein
MAKKGFDQQLAALDALRDNPDPAGARIALGKALAHQNNYIVAKAAKVSKQLGMKELIPDLLAAIDRFFINAGKSDPQCWAKNGIIDALAEFGHDDSAIYLRGIRHVQLEPVWGGQQDSAGPLRARCALALVQCRDLSDTDLLSHLIELLADPDRTVRVEAARAVGNAGSAQAALLLRLRALMGDPEPEVFGACLMSVLSIQGAVAIDFVSRFLHKDDDAAREAALALASLHDSRAFVLLKQRWADAAGSTLRPVLLTAMGLTRVPQAVDFLISLVESDSQHAGAAVEALAAMRSSEEIRLRTAAAIDRSGNARLRSLFDQHFS